MADKNRPLHILKYLWDHTDEEHPAIITDILAHLESCGIHTNRKTVASDLADLQDSGFDIVCNKSRQNQYFIGSRTLELAELKMIVDAVQAAKFISESKSVALIEKISALASPHQAEQLKRRLYVEGKAKTTNEAVNYTVDLLQSAIQSESAVEFHYTEYTARKKKELKHDGYLYRISPYDLVWNNDCYYIFGWSQKHDKIVKFRVDRMHQPKLSAVAYHPRPEDYDISDYCERVFMMYEGKPCKVKLLCDNSLMKAIIDRFGEDVETHIHDDNSFSVVAEISASATFYSWLFTYGGKMKIVEPKAIRDEYERRLNEALKNR